LTTPEKKRGNPNGERVKSFRECETLGKKRSEVKFGDLGTKGRSQGSQSNRREGPGKKQKPLGEVVVFHLGGKRGGEGTDT